MPAPTDTTRHTLAALIGEAGVPLRLRRHHYLVRRGERPDKLVLIQDGWAARYKILRDGRRHISQFYTPGDLCDPSWLVSRDAGQSVIAVTPIRALAIDCEQAEERFSRAAAFSRRVASDSLSRLEAQAEWLVSLGCKSARERVGQLVCELYLRLERTGRAAHHRCEFPLSQQHLADFTGMTAVHVCRTLGRMRDDRLIDVKSRRLSILDSAGLTRTCSFDAAYLGAA